MEKDFIAALNNAGYEPRSYSGRGMYGDSCVAIVTDDHPFKVGIMVMAALYDGFDTWKLENVESDSMGRSTVLYWPSVKWPDDSDEE